MPVENTLTAEQKALKQFVDTIDATGGLVKFDDGTFGCAADPEWIDLADAALTAKKALAAGGITVALRLQNEVGIAIKEE